MTKDYYEILSVRSDATDEEIRARWIELVKSYHVDFDMGEFDERVKDINDAYHVLKNPATRLEYDMERTFKRKKKGAPLKKWSLRLGLGVVLIVLCVIYFERPEIPQQLLETSRSVSVFSQNQKRLPISEPGKAPVVQAVKEEASTSGQTSLPAPPQGETGIDQTQHGTDPADQRKDQSPEALKVVRDGSGDQAKGKKTETPALSERAKLEKATRPASETHSVLQPADADKASQASRPQRNLASKSASSKTAEGAPVKKVTEMAQVNAPSPKMSTPSALAPANPSSLLAREEEVKEFFLNYTRAYNRVDLDTFLALFSPRAVQNREESFEDLKATYRRFFNQSQEVHYELQDLKFEIYRNGVEATARYVLDQTSKRNGAKQTWRGTVRWALIRENGALKIISLDYKHQESL